MARVRIVHLFYPSGEEDACQTPAPARRAGFDERSRRPGLLRSVRRDPGAISAHPFVKGRRWSPTEIGAHPRVRRHAARALAGDAVVRLLDRNLAIGEP